MSQRIHRVAAVSLLATALLVGTPPGATPQPVPADARPGSSVDPRPAGERDDACGPLDLPETGIQGDVPLSDQESGRAEQGYNCGLSLVGHTTLDADGRTATGNANMAWAGDCAYVAGSGNLDGSESSDPNTGVAVVDASDPVAPRHVRTLRTDGARGTLETLHAVDAADRSILVVGRYGAYPFTGPAPVDIYDVRDCANPVLLSTLEFPHNVHNLTLTADATRVYSTIPLAAADISDPRRPTYLGNLEDQLRGQFGTKLTISHEAWPSTDGDTLTVGGQLPTDDGTLTSDGLLVIDVSAWPEQPARIVGRGGGPGHSIRSAAAGGRQLLVNSDESPFPLAYGCLTEAPSPFAGTARTYLTDVSDPTRPTPLSEIGLAINEPTSCAAQLQSGTQASTHYHDVDNATDTTFVMVSMWNAGVRVIDVRDPLEPREVAYFNPGDVARGDEVVLDHAWGHVHYVPETGHIWFATADGGFWVVELQPQVRARLGFDPAPSEAAIRHPRGRSGTDGVAVVPAARRIETDGLYCSLATTTGSTLALPAFG